MGHQGVRPDSLSEINRQVESIKPRCFDASLWTRVLQELASGGLRPCRLCDLCDPEFSCDTCAQCVAWCELARQTLTSLNNSSPDPYDSVETLPDYDGLPEPASPAPLLVISNVTSISSWSSVESLEIPGAPPPSFGWESDSGPLSPAVGSNPPSPTPSYSWDLPLDRSDTSSDTVQYQWDLEDRIEHLREPVLLQRRGSVETPDYSDSDSNGTDRSHESDFW